ncbi:hypothetical protein TNCV_556621 [Trichonephila clavipes]|uniref:Uncharacterized protein n=1 Tax=Trichonephila clavipes TaxID=2585209 RepID=A0A8X6V6X6_TRICX|nr:hypothetical protein TNCV_556621 [Trichonephila clavipes]
MRKTLALGSESRNTKRLHSKNNLLPQKIFHSNKNQKLSLNYRVPAHSANLPEDLPKFLIPLLVPLMIQGSNDDRQQPPCTPMECTRPLALYEDECHIDNVLTCRDVRACRSGKTGVSLSRMVFAGEIYRMCRICPAKGCMSSLW